MEGVHWPKDADYSLVAHRALRSNLSDLAAKGARPLGYFLGCVWPKTVERAAIDAFGRGLAACQEEFRVRLYGGDTTRHALAGAPATISVTVFGTPAKQGLILRSGAAAGDDLYVSGAIGDAMLALAAIKNGETPEEQLAARFWRPSPRIALGGALSGVASAAIDVSDGLLADIGHIAAASGLAAVVELRDIPLSEHGASYVAASRRRDDALISLASFGDDYEIAFSAPSAMRRSVDMAATVTKTPVCAHRRLKARRGRLRQRRRRRTPPQSARRI